MMQPRMGKLERLEAKQLLKQSAEVGYPLCPLSELAIRICLAYTKCKFKQR